MAVNYQLDVINPFQAALQGYGAGAQILQQERAGAQQARQAQMQEAEFAQKGQLFGLQMQEAQARLQTLQDEKAKAAAAQAADAELFDRMDDPDFLENTSAGDIARIMSRNPEVAKFIQTETQKLGDEKKLAAFNQNWSIASALELNNPQQAQALIDQYATAFENSGRPDDAKAMRAMGEQMKTPAGRDTIKKSMLVNASVLLPDQYDKLSKTLAETKKLPYELRKLNLEADQLAAANSGILPRNDMMKLEDGYRQEYTKAAAPYKAMQEAMSSIFASAKEGSPAGDIALVTQFRKLLDPTSVVRETEFAQTAEAGGLITRLQTEVDKLSGGGVVTQDTRDEIVRLSRNLMRAADAYERRRREDIDYRADKYGLDKKAIYGVGVAGEMPSDLPDYPNMTMEQRANVNPLAFKTVEEARLFIDSGARLLQKLIGGGQ
jgi:hypothetical protein